MTNKYNDKIKMLSIEKSFGKRKILIDVTISLEREQVIALLGPNGSGKTTLFYIIAGLLAPDKGRVIFNDTDITLYPMYQRARMGLGYLPQEVSIFRGLTVEENIEVILQIYEKDKIIRMKRLEQLLQDFTITHIRKSNALALSGGEKRRVELARALAASPKFILLDEPFAGVDPIAVGDLKQLIFHLKDRGIGVLITDHNAKETLGIIDRGYVLYEGKILAEGTQNTIINDPLVKKVYLGNTF